MTTSYHVITESTGWSFVVKPDGSRDGPYRYRWEADEVADELNGNDLARGVGSGEGS